MSLAYDARSSRVLIVEESGSGRQLLADAVRALGFLDLTVVSSGGDALHLLEVDNFDWVICSMLAKQEVNALHLLRATGREPRLKNACFSFVVDEGELGVLEAAFAFGLMSYHPRTYMRDQMELSLQKLVSSQKRNNFRSPLVAVEYFRSYQRATKQFATLVKVEKSLAAFFPGCVHLLLGLGEDLLLAGETEDGVRTLQQVGLLDPRAKLLAQEIMTKAGGNGASGSKFATGERLNVLGVNSCVLIDPDSAVLGGVRSLLASVGVRTIHAFDDAKAAWEWLSKNPEPDLIMQEWRMSGIPGPLMLQRVRQLGFVNVPIVVVSSMVKPAESPLLREMGVDHVIPKPFGPDSFFRGLVWTLQQARQPTDQKSLERKIRRLLESGNRSEAERLRQIHVADPRIPTVSKQLVEAEFSFRDGKFRAARNLAIEALKLSGDSLMLLNLIGKSLLKLGDYPAAMRFFEKVQALSPLNVEHLCNLAVAQYETGNDADAEAVLGKARALDPASNVPREIECQYAIVRGDSERAKALMDELKSTSKIVAYMNNRAVALTRCGRYSDGIELYHRTMASLPGEWSDTHDAVTYNLGLALARFGDLGKAREQLGKVQSKGSTLHKRSTSLIARIDMAERGGKELSFFSGAQGLNEADFDDGTAQVEAKAIDVVLEIRPGDRCLMNVFEMESVPPEVAKLIENEPRIKSRSAFGRPESFVQRVRA